MIENRLPVTYRPNPFRTGHVDRVCQEGSTIAQMIAEVGLESVAMAHNGLFVFVGDELVERGRWEELKLVRGDIVSIGISPAGGGGGGGKSPARTVAMIALMVVAIAATWYVGGAGGITMGLAEGSFELASAGAAAGMAVGIAGSLLINAWIPLPTLKTKKDDQKNYLQGMSNQIDPYGIVPRLFGRHKIFPRYAAVPYTELVGTDEQYLRVLFCIGKGKYALSSFKIGDTLLGDYTNVQMEQYYTGDSTFYKLFPNDPTESALAIELVQNVSHTQTTGANVDEITVVLTFPLGIYRIASGGNRHATTVTVKIEYAVHSSGAWKDITAGTQIKFTGYPSTSIAAGQTIVGPSGQGTIYATHQTSQNIDTGTDDADGRDIYVYTEYTDWITLTITSGTFTAGQACTIAGAYAATIDTVASIGFDYTAQYGSAIQKAYTWQVPKGTYDVRVTKTSGETTETEFKTIYWTNLQTITYQTPVNLVGCTLVALRIKATGQLMGMIDKFNCIAESLNNAYDGANWHLVKTRSPAWAYSEVLCGNSNKRAMSTTRLDTTALRAFDAACTSSAFTFDGVVDYKTTAWELLRQICAAGRASPGLTDNKYTVILDTVRTIPIQHFGPRNSWDFSGSRSFYDLPHALRIRFPNEAEDFTEDETVVFDDGYNSGNATLYETLDFFGITNYNQIWKLARYHIAVMRLRPETYTFTVDVEHMVCTRGDLVRINHDVLMVGLAHARVKSISTTQVSVDDVIAMEVGKNYGFQFRRADGTFKTCTITTSAGEKLAGTVLTINPAMAGGDIPAIGDLCFFGETTNESIDALVSRIEPGPDLTAKITCVPYNAAIYTADSGAIPAWTSGITLPPVIARTPPKPHIIAATYIYRQTNMNADGSLALIMSVGFDCQSSVLEQGGSTDPNFAPPDVTQGFNAEFREDDGNWIQVPTIGPNERSFEFAAKDTVSYDIRMRSFSTPGTTSDWDTLSNITATYSVAVPGNVAGLLCVGGGTSFLTKDLEVTWTAVVGADNASRVVGYKVEVTTTGDVSLRVEYPTQNKYVYSFDKNITDGGPRPSVKIKVQALNALNALSATPTSVTFTNPVPANPSGLTTFSPMGSCEFNWTPNIEPDFSHYLYQLQVGGETGNIAYVGAGAGSVGTTSVTPAYPGSIAAGDLFVMHVVNKYPTNGPSTPSGWTAVTNGQATGGAGSAAADSGTVYSTIFTREAVGSESGTVTVTVTGSNSSRAIIYAFRKTAGASWDVAATNGADNSAGTSWSVTGAADPGIMPGDWVCAASGINSDAPSFATEAMAAGGVTSWDTLVELDDSASTTGDDIRQVFSYHRALTGTSNAAPVFTMTGSATSGNYPAGATVILRLRVTGYIAGWIKTLTTNVARILTQNEKDVFGSDAGMVFQVKAVDYFAQESGSTLINGITGSLNIKETDIDDFAITASKVFNKIPVIQGLTLTDDTPTADKCTWSACTLTYDGVAYSIVTGATPTALTAGHKYYIYWKDKNATAFSTLIDVHPTAQFSDWKPGEDFIIAVYQYNVAPQEAWNAIANEVIGSAYIMNAAIQDAHVSSLSGTKISASSSVAIGPATTWQTNGIQLQYNAGTPRFYAGNDAKTRYIQYDGTNVDIAGRLSLVAGGSSDASILNSYNVNPGNSAKYPNFEGKVDFAGDLIGGWSLGYNLNKPNSGGINFVSGTNYFVTGSNCAYWSTPAPYGGAESSNYSYIFSSQIPVTVGKKYCFSVYTNAFRCCVFITVAWIDATGGWISSTTQAVNDGIGSNGNILTGYTRLSSSGVAPSNTATAILYIYKNQTKVGQTNSYAFACLPMFSEIGSDQTVFPPWAAGGTDNSAWADTSGLISSASLGSTIITGGYINTSLLTASNIVTGTLTANVINAGSINYTKLGSGAATTTNVASGTTSTGWVPISFVGGGESTLVIGRAAGTIGSKSWHSTGGEGGGFYTYDPGAITVNIYRLNEAHDAAILIGSHTVEARGGTFTEVICPVIDACPYTTPQLVYYGLDTGGSSCKIEISSFRR